MDQEYNVPVIGCFCDGEFDTMKNRNGFTLIELLVVVAIIGIIASIGVVAYSGYTNAAKRSATLANHKQIVKFIKHSFQMCDVNGGGNYKLGKSPNTTINCDSPNYQGYLHNFNDAYIKYFEEQGFTNVYDKSVKALYTATNGKQDTNGRFRFDITECPPGASKYKLYQLIVWVKTHKDYYPTTVAKDGWCR